MDYVNQLTGSAQIFVPQYEMYAETDSRYLPIRIVSDSKQYILFSSSSSDNSHLIFNERVVFNSFSNIACNKFVSENESFTVNDCIELCQRVLGLKINEISKLVGVSRATLDLHRKGAVNMRSIDEYKTLYDFVKNVEYSYGENISLGARSVIINNKTLLQHLLENKNTLANAFPIVDEVSKKISNVRFVRTVFDEDKQILRLSKIGSKA